jgi:hypothetical protein
MNYAVENDKTFVRQKRFTREPGFLAEMPKNQESSFDRVRKNQPNLE